MSFLSILLVIIIIYMLLMYVFSILLIPNLGWFKKNKDRLPDNVINEMKKLGKRKMSKKQLLNEVMEYQLKRFYSRTAVTWKYPLLLFESSPRRLWQKGGFLHCHQQSLILKELLLATGKFKQDDIKIRITTVYIEIHQHLAVNTGKDWIKADAFAMSCGFPFGEDLPFLALHEAKIRRLVPKPETIEHDI